MSMTYHERPGVYSQYDASTITATGRSARILALVGLSEAQAGLYTLTSYASSKDVFGADSQLGKMLRLAYLNGAGTVLACPVAQDSVEAYKAAFALVFAEKKASYCVIGSAKEDVQTALRDAVEEASEQRGECIGFCGMENPEDADLTARAMALNSERMVLLAPDVCMDDEGTMEGGCMAASAMAGALCDQSDPALPLNGLVLRGLYGVSKVYTDTEYDALAQGGVTAAECIGGKVSIIRALTTRTKTGGAQDMTFRELSTVLIIDDVIPSIREALRAKFTRAKNNALTRKAIRNQVVIELEERIEREIIDSFDDLTVTAAENDASTCVVEFSFTVVHGLNRIRLIAHISI
ncbi:MAG: phage tail sheath protein [Oscillospiraceae bacterium]|nr:phage tail sheath protein [Oscillospiraceae bacterium]